MDGKAHAFMLFTKAPVSGRTKTRLTEARGGILTPQEATDFYIACLLDVADIGFKALEQLNDLAKSENSKQPDRYDFIVSCSPPSDLNLLESLFAECGPWTAPVKFIIDRGVNFDQHFDDAFQQLFSQGYHSVVSIGGDLPVMPVSHIVSAFQWLAYFESVSERGGFVQAPCQECGVSLVGYTANTPMDSVGVFYNPDGVPALDAYVHKARQRHIPLANLSPVADVDDVYDLAHTCSLIRAMEYASQYQPDVVVPRRTLDWIERNGIVITTPPNPEHDPREAIDA